MERFNTQRAYSLFGNLVATASVLLQLILVLKLFGMPLDPMSLVMAFVLAYFLTDLINGLIHMIMDHHENYDSFYGPLTANFHLHHQTPKYVRKPLPMVYFHETGAKVWLPVYLLMTCLLGNMLNPFAFHVMVYVGVLSSVAEVSHYLCHSSQSRIYRFLARIGLLLSWKHHAPHHGSDNRNYAFLNGVSDPLLNWIASRFFPGYKHTTDLHFGEYDRGAVRVQR